MRPRDRVTHAWRSGDSPMGVCPARDDPGGATEAPRVPYVTQLLQGSEGPIVATTDYMRLFAEQIRAYIPSGRTYKVLGTDGFGRSDSRAKLREFFEVNRYYITVAALKSLAEEGKIDAKVVSDAIAKYGIDPNKPNPVTQ